MNLLQISMPIILPVSGSGGISDKGAIAMYLACFVLWILQLLYSLIFNKLKLKEALSLDDDYFLAAISNGIFYCLTIVALIIALGAGIYKLL